LCQSLFENTYNIFFRNAIKIIQIIRSKVSNRRESQLLSEIFFSLGLNSVSRKKQRFIWQRGVTSKKKLRMRKQTSLMRNYPVESRSQIAIGGEVYHRPFFFIFGTTSLIKDLGLIGSRGGCPTERKDERSAVDQTRKKKIEKDREREKERRNRNPRSLLKATWQSDTVILVDVAENVERQ